MTDDYDIGDVIRATLGNPLDAVVKGIEEPAIEEQVRAPTPNELSEIEKLATEAAGLQDELRAAVGDKQRRLKALTGQLKDQMIRHGLNDVRIAGRPPIELTTRSNRKPTQKSIVAAMQKEMVAKLGDEKKGKAEGKRLALNLWNSIEPTVSQNVSIPDPSPPEVEAPY